MATRNRNHGAQNDDQDRWARQSFTFRRMSKANIWALSIALIAVAAILTVVALA